MHDTELPLALLHHQFGPYHLARARELRRQFRGPLHLVQLAGSEHIRAWHSTADDLVIETVAEGVLEDIPAAVMTAGMERLLQRLKPRALAIAGYGHPGMRRAAIWARRQGARSILMSDSQSQDLPRRRWREWMKGQWVSRHFDAAFVSGAAAAFYVQSLGLPAHRIWRGYDVVDNSHFRQRAGAVRADEDRQRWSLNLPPQYLLYVGRFIPEKNLPRLIEAFNLASKHAALEGWSLVLAGSGPLEPELRRLASPLGDRVRFMGFQQFDSLAAFYALAAALILPSVSESWGLVVNEAMASGLPIVVSSRCGCALDLVFPGVNGWIIDPLRSDNLAAALIAVASDADRRRRYGAASDRIVEDFTPLTWADALVDCVKGPSEGEAFK